MFGPFQFSSTITPTKRASDLCSIFVLFINTSMFSKFIFLEKSMYLVFFLGFRLNKVFLSHHFYSLWYPKVIN